MHVLKAVLWSVLQRYFTTLLQQIIHCAQTQVHLRKLVHKIRSACDAFCLQVQVAAPEAALAFKQCYLQKAEEQEQADYAAKDCEAYVTAMHDALKQRQCNPLLFA